MRLGTTIRDDLFRLTLRLRGFVFTGGQEPRDVGRVETSVKGKDKVTHCKGLRLWGWECRDG